MDRVVGRRRDGRGLAEKVRSEGRGGQQCVGCALKKPRGFVSTRASQRSFQLSYRSASAMTRALRVDGMSRGLPALIPYWGRYSVRTDLSPASAKTGPSLRLLLITLLGEKKQRGAKTETTKFWGFFWGGLQRFKAPTCPAVPRNLQFARQRWRPTEVLAWIFSFRSTAVRLGASNLC